MSAAKYNYIKNRLQNHFDAYIDNLLWGRLGKDSKVIKPMRIIGKRRVFIGDKVTILNMARIETVHSWGEQKLEGRLTIGDGSSFEQCCHLIAAKDVKIGKGCVFSSFVYISDCSHGYSPQKGIMESDLEIKPVSIGDHCFIGTGSCIMPGSTLGNNVVIGANSVVTGEIPDNSMAVGSPARIIKKYDMKTDRWIRI